MSSAADRNDQNREEIEIARMDISWAARDVVRLQSELREAEASLEEAIDRLQAALLCPSCRNHEEPKEVELGGIEYE